MTPDLILPKSSDLSRCPRPAIQAPSTCYGMNDMAKFHVFEDEIDDHVRKTHDIPRGLLRWHSSHFATALDPESDLGSKNRELSLNEDHAVFAAFVCWIWTGRLRDIPDSIEGATVSDFYLAHKLLYKIWVLRGVPGLCNAVIDMLHEESTVRWRKWDTPEFHVPWIYANTVPGAMLRLFSRHDSCPPFPHKR